MGKFHVRTLTLTCQNQLNSTRVVALLDSLARASVEGVEPLAHPLELSVRLREDVVTEGDRSDELLALAGESQGGYYLVPRVID